VTEEKIVEVTSSMWLRGYFTQDKDVPKMIYYHFVNIMRFKLLLILILGIIGFVLSELLMDYVVTYRTSISNSGFDFPTTIFEQAILLTIFMIAFVVIGYFGIWILLDRTNRGRLIHYQESRPMVFSASMVEQVDEAWSIIENYYTFKFPRHGPYFTLRFAVPDNSHKKLLELFKSQKKIHLKKYLETEDFFALHDPQNNYTLIFSTMEEFGVKL